MYRNEKRRIESTGEAPSWQYYHEVDELLGSHADNPMDSSNFDDNNMANSSSISEFICKIQYTFALNPSFFLFIQTFFQQSTVSSKSPATWISINIRCDCAIHCEHVRIEDEVVSIGDSGSDNDLDESQYASGDNHSSKNGYDHPPKKVKFMVFIFIAYAEMIYSE